MAKEIQSQQGSLSKRDLSSLTLVERMKMRKNRPCLLIDTSGSMGNIVEGNSRRIDVVKNIVKDIPPSDIIVFNDIASVAVDIKDPSGSTVMSAAISLAKKKGFKKAIMLTDGENNKNDWKTCLKEVEDFELQVMYIGSGEIPEFLKLLVLTSKKGGFCSKEDLKFPKELAEKLTLLITNGQERKDILL